MITIELGCSGRRTTQLGFGCSGVMASMDRRASLRMLESAFDAGIRHFDVAPMYGYGEAERCLGEFLAGHSGQCTVATKFGIAPPARARGLLGSARRLSAPIVKALPAWKQRFARGAAGFTGGSGKLPFTAELARASLERSLRALRVERVELFLLHEVTVADLNDASLLRFLEAMTQEGKIGTFGVASARGAANELIRDRVAHCPVVQTEWTLHERVPAPGSFYIHHRVFAEVLSSLRSELDASPELSSRWSTETGVDLRDAKAAAALVWKLALVSNPKGLLLFSSRAETQLRANVAVAENDVLDRAARRLLELLRTEGFPQPIPDRRRVA